METQDSKIIENSRFTWYTGLTHHNHHHPDGDKGTDPIAAAQNCTRGPGSNNGGSESIFLELSKLWKGRHVTVYSFLFFYNAGEEGE